jgi:hypothetical protein
MLDCGLAALDSIGGSASALPSNLLRNSAILSADFGGPR